eukprot:883181-Amphidinium_carterae.1
MHTMRQAAIEQQQLKIWIATLSSTSANHTSICDDEENGERQGSEVFCLEHLGLNVPVRKTVHAYMCMCARAVGARSQAGIRACRAGLHVRY